MSGVGGLSLCLGEDCCIANQIANLSPLIGESDLADYLSLNLSNENIQSQFPHCSK